MAIALAQTVKTNDALSAGTTIAVTVTGLTAGNLVVVGTYDNNNTGTVSVSDGTANTYTDSGATSSNTGIGSRNKIFYNLAIPNGGSTTVTATWGTSAGYRGIVVWEVSGFTTAAVDVTGVTSNANGGTAPNDLNGPSVTTTSTTGFVAATANENSSITASPKVGNEFTTGTAILALGATGACALISSTAAAHQPVWTDSAGNDPYNASVVAFKETAGGGGVTVKQLALLGVG